jgi:dolichol-phosphate mannosyltransferase
MNKILVFIPTYNEVGNVQAMCEQIMALPLPLDLHFTDDASPDGTGQELDRLASLHPRVTATHRAGKLGIGSAHQEGISYAYQNGYELLITMDCDFTHSPVDIPRLIDASQGYDVVVGSRFLQQNSLPGWPLIRRVMTTGGHFLTKTLLGMPCDTSGAFRVYDLRRIPRDVFVLVSAKGYAFFFESLFILSQNGFKINEVPIVLPSRVAGTSKMSLKEICRGLTRLFLVSILSVLQPRRFKLSKP